MGAACCKNALDKVRPPARPSSFDAGEPPDPAAPWPGDTFCRAPATQAPPVFPEGAFDSPRLGSFPSNAAAAYPVAAAAAEEGPPGLACPCRSSMPAGSGSTAVSLSLNQEEQQQRNLRVASFERGGRANSAAAAGPRTHDGSSVNSSWPATGATHESDAAGAAGGTRRLSGRLRQALRTSRMRLTSRLRMGAGGAKQESGGGTSPPNVGGGGTAVSSAATASCTGDAAFPKDAVDETHFVRYPPSLSQSSECLNALWPAAARPWPGAAEPPPASSTGDTTAAAARGSGRAGGGENSGGQWTTGSGLASTAVSWTTPASSSPSAAPLGRETRRGDAAAAEQEETARGRDTGTGEGGKGGTAKKPFFGGVVSAPALTKKKRSSCSNSSGKDQGWLLKRSKGSSAASSFRAAVEGALPRWKGSRLPKERKGRARSRSNSGSSAEGRGWRKTKKGQELLTSGKSKRMGCKSNNTQRDGVRLSALRSSHCSSASTAAQEEDDYTTAGMEYWWTARLPNQQEADDEQLTTEVHSAEFQGTVRTAISGGCTSSLQPVAVSPLRQQQQQLPAGGDVAVPAGPTLGAGAQAQAGAAALGRAPTAFTGTSLGGAGHPAEYTTDRLLFGPSPAPIMHDASRSSTNASGSHFVANADAAGAEGTDLQQPQQLLTNGRRIETPSSSFAGPDAHGYTRQQEYSNAAGSSSSSYTSSSNTHTSGGGSSGGGRSSGDVNLAAAAIASGSSRQGVEDAGRGGPWGEAETSVIALPDAALHDVTLQQQHSAGYRQQEIQSADKSGSTSNGHTHIITMPFPE